MNHLENAEVGILFFVLLFSLVLDTFILYLVLVKRGPKFLYSPYSLPILYIIIGIALLSGVIAVGIDLLRRIMMQ